jgi:hypothetical protein
MENQKMSKLSLTPGISGIPGINVGNAKIISRLTDMKINEK